MDSSKSNEIAIGKNQAHCVGLFLEGNSIENIATTLNIHVRTVEFYIRTLLVKLKNLIDEL